MSSVDTNDYEYNIAHAPSVGEALYQLDRLVAQWFGGQPFDTLSAMAARGAHISTGWATLARFLDFISPYHAEHAAEDQARREATGVDDHQPIMWMPGDAGERVQNSVQAP